MAERLCLGDKCPNAQAQKRAETAQERVKTFRSRLAEYADSLSVSETHKRLYESMMVLDLTTGVYNSKGLAMKFDEELARFQRFGRRFGLLFMRIDGFEKLKAERGEKAADKILVMVAGALKESIRPYDSVHRLDNADFTELLPETNNEKLASVIAERLRTRVEKLQLAPDRTNDVFSMTVSIGVAVLDMAMGPGVPRDAKKELDRMLGNAMRAEEMAEKEGMNRVSIAPLQASGT